MRHHAPEPGPLPICSRMSSVKGDGRGGHDVADFPVDQRRGHASFVFKAAGDDLHERSAFPGPHPAQEVLFGDHSDDATVAAGRRSARYAFFGQQGRGGDQVGVGIDRLHRRGHDVGGLQGVHHALAGKIVRHPINFPEVGRGDVDIALHGFHGRHDIFVGNIDGGALSKIG